MTGEGILHSDEFCFLPILLPCDEGERGEG
jgi:hypothetical protein